MKIDISKDECMRLAEQEDGGKISAGIFHPDRHRDIPEGAKPADPRSNAAQELARRDAVRDKIAVMLWEKQFEGTVWAGKIHLIAPRSLEPYREFADRLIAVARGT